MFLKHFIINNTYRYLHQLVFRDLKLNFQQFVYKTMDAKPPNILVYTGSNSPKLFKEIENNLLKCLRMDNYIVYHLLASEINKHPWMENCLLLVISSDVIEDSIAKAFETYFKNFGCVLLICSKVDGCLIGNECNRILDGESLIQIKFKHFEEMFMFRGKYSYCSNGTVLCHDNNKKPLIQKITHNKNILITSEIYLDRNLEITDMSSEYNDDDRLLILKCILKKEFELKTKNDNFVPELVPGYYISSNEYEFSRIMHRLKLDDISSEKSIFNECNLNNSDVHVTLPIYFYHKNLFPSLKFDENLYFSKLHTDTYGHHLVYFPVITSTMEVAEQLSEYEGIVIVADYQISGKGRGTNKWISPEGCAMFTLHFTVPLCSHLGKRMTLLQHIASLAVVYGIKSQQLYQDLELKVKWPNDIYHGKTKIGGLIVTSVVQRDVAHVNIGWGINVKNSCPTSCLNDIVDKYNSGNSSSLPQFHVEEIVAFTVSHMEYFVKDFIESGSEKFFTHYYSHWMHNNQQVTLINLNQQGTVIGINEFGFLKVKTNNGKIIILQPDGNRFDIMKNLIHVI